MAADLGAPPASAEYLEERMFRWAHLAYEKFGLEDIEEIDGFMGKDMFMLDPKITGRK